MWSAKHQTSNLKTLKSNKTPARDITEFWEKFSFNNMWHWTNWPVKIRLVDGCNGLQIVRGCFTVVMWVVGNWLGPTERRICSRKYKQEVQYWATHLVTTRLGWVCAYIPLTSISWSHLLHCHKCDRPVEGGLEYGSRKWDTSFGSFFNNGSKFLALIFPCLLE